MYQISSNRGRNGLILIKLSILTKMVRGCNGLSIEIGHKKQLN